MLEDCAERNGSSNASMAEWSEKETNGDRVTCVHVCGLYLDQGVEIAGGAEVLQTHEARVVALIVVFLHGCVRIAAAERALLQTDRDVH